MTEEQFVEFCILIGNDFTAPFERQGYDNTSLFRASNYDTDEQDRRTNANDGENGIRSERGRGVQNTAVPQGYDFKTYDVLRALIMSGCNSFQLLPSSAELQLAVEYSRAFYQLEDLSSYPVTRYSNENEAMKLTRQQTAVINEMVALEMSSRRQAVDGEGMALLRPADAAVLALRFLRTVASPVRGLPEIGIVSFLHVEALELMLAELSEQRLLVAAVEMSMAGAPGAAAAALSAASTSATSLLGVYGEPRHPCWADIFAANLYQRAIGEKH
jgi:hypothetical protein